MPAPLRITIISLLCLLFFFVVVMSFFVISDGVAHSLARVVPSYAKEDISAVLEKEQWSDEDYSFLYRQTGLSRSALDEYKNDKSFILACQDDLFYDGEVSHDAANFGSSHDYFPDKTFHIVSLRPGDVLISSSVHTLGWRNGHAALVLNSSQTLQAITIGVPSRVQGLVWFKEASNFMVLRPKNIDQSDIADIVAYAWDNLVNVQYSLFTGIFNEKNQAENPQTTQCAHLVWQAYMAFGYDIDSDGGPVVTPKDIANSPYFEVIQVNGFDLEKLWR